MPRTAAPATPAPRTHRRVLFEGAGWQDCPVYDRYALRTGTQLQGPALIEERESTCVIGSGHVATVDPHFNLVANLDG